MHDEVLTRQPSVGIRRNQNACGIGFGGEHFTSCVPNTNEEFEPGHSALHEGNDASPAPKTVNQFAARGIVKSQG
jgi:hypothetical protein